MKKTSLSYTICYFLMQVRSTFRICKGRDIAVILTEKRGAVDIFLNLNQGHFIFYFCLEMCFICLKMKYLDQIRTMLTVPFIQ